MSNLQYTTSEGITVYTSASIACVQGILWTLSSLFAILKHFGADVFAKVNFATESYQDSLGGLLFYVFIKNSREQTSMIIQPMGYFAVMVVYFVLNLAWTISSLYIMFIYRNGYPKNRIFRGFNVWTIISSVILLTDFILCCLLCADLNHVINGYNTTHDINIRLSYQFAITAYGIMVIVASKGFALWLINLLLTASIMRLSSAFNPKKFKNPNSALPKSNDNSSATQNSYNYQNASTYESLKKRNNSRLQVTNSYYQQSFADNNSYVISDGNSDYIDIPDSDKTKNM